MTHVAHVMLLWGSMGFVALPLSPLQMHPHPELSSLSRFLQAAVPASVFQGSPQQ